MKNILLLLLIIIILLLGLACAYFYNNPSTKVRVKYAEIAAQSYLEGREDVGIEGGYGGQGTGTGYRSTVSKNEVNYIVVNGSGRTENARENLILQR